MKKTILAISMLYLCQSLFGLELRWSYPADPAPHAPPTHFNVYSAFNLNDPYVLILQVPYVPGQTDYATTAGTGQRQAFYRVSAANEYGESFARKERL